MKKEVPRLTHEHGAMVAHMVKPDPIAVADERDRVLKLLNSFVGTTESLTKVVIRNKYSGEYLCMTRSFVYDVASLFEADSWTNAESIIDDEIEQELDGEAGSNNEIYEVKFTAVVNRRILSPLEKKKLETK